MTKDMASASGTGPSPSGSSQQAVSPVPASVPDAKVCACGNPKPEFWRRCDDCRIKAIIDAATEVAPDSPLCLVDSDTFFGDLEDAVEEHPGLWAHPCDREPLAINPKRTAADLAERVIEDMCEEAFEDAHSCVNGEKELKEAFEAALVIFNAAQTACSWVPRTKEVFRIPAIATEAEGRDGEAGSVHKGAGSEGTSP